MNRREIIRLIALSTGLTLSGCLGDGGQEGQNNPGDDNNTDDETDTEGVVISLDGDDTIPTGEEVTLSIQTDLEEGEDVVVELGSDPDDNDAGLSFGRGTGASVAEGGTIIVTFDISESFTSGDELTLTIKHEDDTITETLTIEE